MEIHMMVEYILDYFPPREGKESFISAMSSAQAQDIHAISLYGTACAAWGMINRKLGKRKWLGICSKRRLMAIWYQEASNRFKPSTQVARMCMATQFWQDKYASLCDSAVNTYQTNGVYMDVACHKPKCVMTRVTGIL